MAPTPTEEFLRAAAPEVVADPRFDRVADGFASTVVFGVDGTDTAVAFDDGSMDVLGSARFVSWDVAFRASADTWTRLLAEVPPPLHHDPVAAWLQADLTVEGDLTVAFRHLRPLKRLFTVFRGVDA